MPLGLLIMVSAFVKGILGNRNIGLLVLAFGLYNKCIFMGNCEIDAKEDPMILNIQ